MPCESAPPLLRVTVSNGSSACCPVGMAETFPGQPSGWAAEQALLRRAVAEINRLRPAFAIVCGDLINEFPGDDGAENVTRRQQVRATLDVAAPRVWQRSSTPRAPA